MSWVLLESGVRHLIGPSRGRKTFWEARVACPKAQRQAKHGQLREL